MLTCGLRDATRNLIALRFRMDCRVKPGNDELKNRGSY
jgi:hypothetical protein